MKVKKGNIHQGNIKSYGQGFQCTIIAIMALLTIYGTPELSPSDWNAATIDRIVVQGSAEYDSIILSSDRNYPRYLAHNEVPNFFHVIGRLYQVDVHDGLFYGVIGQEGSAAAMSVSFFTAVNTAFHISPMLLFTSGGVTVSIYQGENQYFVFDSHARDDNGFPSSSGTAVMMSFSSIDELVGYFFRSYVSHEFNISPVNILCVDVNNFDAFNKSSVNRNTSTQHSSCSSSMPNQNVMNCMLEESDDNCMGDQSTDIADENVACNADGDISDSSYSGSRTSADHLYVNPSEDIVLIPVEPRNIISQESNDGLAEKNMFQVPETAIQTFLNKFNNQSCDQNNLHFSKDKLVPTYCVELKGHIIDHNYFDRKIPSVHSTPSRDSDHVDPVPVEIILHDHKYFGSDKKKRRNKKVTNFSFGLSEKYFSEIQLIPEYTCCSCDKFLFENQVFPCPNHFEHLLLNIGDTLCCNCQRSLKKFDFPNRCLRFNGLDAGEIPRQLQNLTLVEKRLISQVNTFFTLVILPCFPVGQYAQQGFAIHFGHDINNFVSQLPRQLSDTGFACFQSVNGQHRRLPFRIKKVREALEWLVDNNMFYRDITLKSYDDSFYDCDDDDDDVYDDEQLDLQESGIIATNYSQSGPDIDVSCQDTPINFLQFKNCEKLAFPWLFPYGKGTFSDIHPKKITLSQYFKARLYAQDARWRKDITYLMQAVNVLEKNTLSQLIAIYLKVHKGNDFSSPMFTASDFQSSDSNGLLRENSYMFMKKIRGTAAYWKSTLLNLLAMIRNIGPQTLFMTLSANDYHWTELAMTLQLCKESDIQLEKLPFQVQMDPLMTAVHFERRWRALFKHVIKGPLKPFGIISDYFARVEFQARGSAHLHIFLWVKDAPTLLTAESTDSILNYLDSIISTQIPDEHEDPNLHNLVTKLQVHSHRPYCQRAKKCRFNFPYRECEKTRLLHLVELGTSPCKKFYETKRNARDSMINPYNPIILRHWKANMDLQMIGGPYGIACYICNYICKSEPDNLKTALAELLSSFQAQNPVKPLREKMFAVGMCILKHRTLSAQEAAYRLSDLNFISSTRETVYLPAFPPHKQYRRLKSQEEISALASNSTDLFYSNIIEDYHNRPHALDNICLFRYAQQYKKKNDNINKSKNANMKLQGSNSVACKCSKPAVVRIIQPTFNSPDYFYSMILLYFPHRQYSDIQGSEPDIKTAFINRHQHFDQDALSMCYSNPSIENAVRAIQLSNIEEYSDLIYNNDVLDDTEQTSLPINSSFDAINFVPEHLPKDNLEDMQDSLLEAEFDLQEWHQVVIGTPQKELVQLHNMLTVDQKNVVHFVTSQFSDNTCQNVFRILITGGAGVGKSFLISYLVKWLRTVTALRCGIDPVCLCAPTGVAAYNVKGSTIHTALHLPVQHSWETCYYELNQKSLRKLKQKFKFIHTLVIDEISMVSSVTLSHIHRRLTSIKGNELPFGGMNVILVGDFFQLKPVMGTFAFTNLMLWPLFTPFFLHQNMRQSGDLHYAQILNRIRIGSFTEEDISCLKTRIVHNAAQLDSSILHIFPTKAEVAKHNENMQKQLNAPVMTFRATHYFSNNDIGVNDDVSNDYIPTKDRDAGGLPNVINLSIGTKVMLIRNLNTECGLVNGAVGIVVGLPENTEDDADVMVLFENMSSPVPIPRYDQEYLYNGRFVVRRNFPLIVCWGCTIHKVQSLSVKEAVICIGNSIFEKGQAYVALSRVQRLDKLHILAFSEGALVSDSEVMNEYLRMHLMNEMSKNAFHRRLSTLPQYLIALLVALFNKYMYI